MKNTRSKKLLACFLTALGLSANSLNASAKNGQTIENIKIENIKFYFNIGKNCIKREEKAQLDELAKDINDFVYKLEIDRKLSSNTYIYDKDEDNIKKYYDFCKLLFENLKSIFNTRNEKIKYDSILYKNLSHENIISSYPGDQCCFERMQNWLMDVSEHVQGGKFTVWGKNIKDAVEKLSKINGQHGDVIKRFDTVNGNLDDKNQGGTIRCCLYKDGHLVVWGTGKNAQVTEKINVDTGNACYDTGLSSEHGKTALKSVLFAENITSIDGGVFQGSDNLTDDLTDVTIQNPIKEIGMGAFMNCKNLESVTLPNSVKKIGYLAFANCRKLESLTIPNSIEQIESDAFSNSGIDSEKLSIKVRVSKNTNIKINDIVERLLKKKNSSMIIVT